jgi:hypothetical protein
MGIWDVDQERQIGLVDMDRESFGEKISQVMDTTAPLYDELATCYPIPQPMVVHLNAFCSLWLDGVISYSLRAPVVC